MENLTDLFKANFGFLKSSDIAGRTQWRELRKMVDDNSVSKLKRGLYQLNNYFEYNIVFTEVANIIPCGVFCMFSALFYYNLTTAIPHQSHIAVVRGKKIKLPAYPPIKLYHSSEEVYNLGITTIAIDNLQVRIYDLEKSVCDAVKFRNKIGIDVTIEVLKNYVKRHDKDLNKLSHYAQQLKIEKVIQNMLMPIL
jgi:predicted transcriptional regulator of viral defense system